MRRTLCLLALLALALRPAFVPADDQPKTVPPDHVERVKKGLALFRGGVRKVLVEQCLECHGGKSVKGEFNLATRKALMASGYVDETAEDSHLMLLLRHEETPHMPFKAPRLPEKSIAAIAKWIDLGAPYDKPLVEGATVNPRAEVTDADREFWSFRPLANVEPPRYETHYRNAIDGFVLASLEEKGLTPNGRADRRTLIRRVYYDLIGLPPTPEQVRAFLADERDDVAAYAAVVDELLASPHYGERWARHWMDVARFAESHGYEQDYDRKNAYHYRDFLVKAFNADQPYDEFVRWQLAGDELAPDEPLAWMATGFLGAGAFPTQLTETEFESARYDELDDMLGTTGTAFLGLTIGCARCHDHKFDPIPNRDYYRMLSTFTTAIRSEIDLETGGEQYQRDLLAWEEQRTELAAALAARERGPVTTALRAWLKSDEAAEPMFSPWRTLFPTAVKSTKGATLTADSYGVVLATGTKPAHDEYVLTARTKLTGIRSLRLEALTADGLVKRGPGRASNGNFALSEIKVTVRALGGPDDGDSQPAPAKLVDARATHQQNETSLSVKASITPAEDGWAVDFGGIGKDQAAVFDFAEPIGTPGAAPGGTEFVITMNFRNNTQHSLGRFRLSLSTLKKPEPVVGTQVSEALAGAFAALTEKTFDELPADQRTALVKWFAPRDETWRTLADRLDAHAQTKPASSTMKVQVTSEGVPIPNHHANGRGFPHFYPQTHFLLRGDPNQKGDVATPGLLRALAPAGEPAPWSVTPAEGAKQSYRRATLAHWMTDAERGAGHLVARVIVNRLWHHHFGRGIVATPSDFGAQGERPTHPELLDWLARDLIANGWQLKRMHALIVTSAAYTRSTATDENRAAIDPDNRLLWRRTPRRLEAEAIRDGMLHVSGLLDTKMFGPGTLDQNHRRRSVYFFIKRSKLIPMMMLFDWPEHLVGIGSRGTTTIAPQALAFLNGPQCRQYAQGLAGRLGEGTLEHRIARAYELAFSRPPTDEELQATTAFLAAQTKRYAETSPADAGNRALVDLCQFLLAANEFVYVD